MERIDTSRWKEFRVGDLFDVSRPVARSQLNTRKEKYLLLLQETTIMVWLNGVSLLRMMY